METVISLNNLRSKTKKRKIINGQNVIIYQTEEPPVGTTFFFTGAMASLTIYDTLIQALLNQNQYVIGIYTNVLFPVEDNHRYRAEKIPEIFDSFHKCHPELPNIYNLVGHSAGGKISLLVAAKYDVKRVTTVIALDPVDQNPPAFTNTNLSSSNETDMNTTLFLNKPSFDNENFIDTNATIILTQSGIYDEPSNAEAFLSAHNAAAIHALNLDTIFIRHENSSHNAYTDLIVENWENIIPSGDPEANAFAKQDALDLIQQYIG